MMHQRHKARAMANKHGMDGGAPPMPSVPDMGPLNPNPPMPDGMQNPSQVMQGPSDGGGPGGMAAPAGGAPAFKRGGRVK